MRYEISVQASAATDQIRTEQLNGNDHMVIPMVVLVEGVIHPSNAPFPELALASEFGKHPGGWDGRPVVLDHPSRDGVPVSANSPDVFESEAFGMLFNTILDGDKLKTEAWIDLPRVAKASKEVRDAIDRLQSGEVTEVSTGLFTSLELLEGDHDGKDFSAVWRDVVPDHLAILPEGVIGACSVEDGCGAPRINKANEIRTMRVAECDDKDGVCRAATLSPRGESKLEDDSTEMGVFQRMMNKFGEFMSFRSSTNTMSDVDTRTAIKAAMTTNSDDYIWIMALFDDRVVYENNFDGSLYSRGYSISSDGSVALSEEVSEVRPVTEFVPVTANQEDSEMAVNKDKVDVLLSNENNTFAEEDRDWITELDDTQFGKLENLSSVEASSSVTEEVVIEPVSPVATPVEITGEGEGGDLDPSPENFISQAPAEMQEVLNSGLKMHRERKGGLVQGLLANKRNKFSADYLNDQSVDTLENLSELANVPTFTGRSNAVLTNAAEDDGIIPAPLEAFSTSKAS